MALSLDFAGGFDQEGSTFFLLGLVLLLSLFVFVYTRAFSPLRYIPGPFWARISPLWRVYRVWLGDWHEDITKLHRKYGMKQI